MVISLGAVTGKWRRSQWPVNLSLPSRGRCCILLLHFPVPVKYVARRTCSDCVRRRPAVPSREAALAG